MTMDDPQSVYERQRRIMNVLMWASATLISVSVVISFVHPTRADCLGWLFALGWLYGARKWEGACHEALVAAQRARGALRVTRESQVQ